MSRITHSRTGAVVGVDTHSGFHVAWAKNALGVDLDHASFPNSPSGFAQLLAWSTSFGEVAAFGIEGPGSYGAGLNRYLQSAGYEVLEVARPSKQHRARHGKSDPADAKSAAAAVLAGEAIGVPKSATGEVEMMRLLIVARSTAIRAKTVATNALHALLATAPDELRERFSDGRTKTLLRQLLAMEAVSIPATPTDAALLAMQSLARRVVALDEEAATLRAHIKVLVEKTCPDLLALTGIGPEIAATMLVACGDNVSRLRSERALAKLCGVCPVDASSGKQIRHRLNRGGNRQANRAVHMAVVVRLRVHPPTRAYMARRLAEGKTKKEVMRCLKRYLVREIFGVIRSTHEFNAGLLQPTVLSATA